MHTCLFRFCVCLVCFLKRAVRVGVEGRIGGVAGGSSILGRGAVFWVVLQRSLKIQLSVFGVGGAYPVYLPDSICSEGGRVCPASLDWLFRALLSGKTGSKSVWLYV